MLDLVDEDGLPTGLCAPRTECHAKGLRHRTSHLWLARRRDGRVQLLLQKRSDNKDSHPGCYDISSAGHIPAGADWVESALRELFEELGVRAAPEELTACGIRRFFWEDSFHGKPFLDRQVSRVFLLWRDLEPGQLTLQKSELSGAVWMDYDRVVQGVREQSFASCIAPDELELLRPFLR